MNKFSSNRIWSSHRTVNLQQRRYRYKKKWAVNRLHRTPSELALDHFDMFYQPVFGRKWPSIRIALLTSQKYCALINNFGELNVVLELKKQGANNIMDLVRNRTKGIDSISHSSAQCSESLNYSTRDLVKDEMCEQRSSYECSFENENGHNSFQTSVNKRQMTESILTHENDVSLREETDMNILADSDLHSFMPAEKVYSNKELLQQEEMKQSIYTPTDVPINIIQDTIMIPEDLNVCAYPMGEITEFKPPKPNNLGLLGYYIMDAASILPVIALNLQSGDNVLDLCAAPGGKSLTILQSLQRGNIVCNDQSNSRLQRLKDILEFYVPSEIKKRVQISKRNGISFTDPSFSKVLVDVPCNTDRHVVITDDNNLFKPGRFSDRLHLPVLQKNLLLAGIRACEPDGSIVYSTCTLSPAQNDGVVQATLEHVWRETRIDLAVQDLSPYRTIFRNIFNFHKCRFGQLVIPSLTQNFGPMYICKIKKLN